MPEVDVQAFASLSASLDGLAGEMKAARLRNQRQAAVIRQIPLAPPQANSAGIIDYPDVLAAKTGFYWSVRRLTLTGWTAGSASVYINSIGGELVAPFPVPAVYTYGRGELLLHPGDRLVAASAGITGYVQMNGAADCLEDWYLPYYLG